jgi:Right handed beta helix region
MRRSLLLAVVGVLCVPTLSSNPAHAQATRTWVSGVGDDANPCSRTAPCKTFAGAISKTATNGIINCLDPGGFGAVTITKSTTIDCTHTGAGVLASLTNGIIVNAPAGSNVILRGLDIEGAGNGLNGIRFLAGGSLQVEKCTIFGFTGVGIQFVPAAAAQLYVSDTSISLNNQGIFVDPGAGSALVTLQRVQVKKNFEGFRATGGGGGGVFAGIQDSLASANGTHGFVAQTPGGGASVILDIQRSSSNLHGSDGIRADGVGASVFIGSSMVTANTTGFSQVNGGVIRSYGNNAVDSNTFNGASTPPNVSPL